ncbi:MAG: acryloyl-CoA reductase [Alphaproteobacteria bacterium]|jgi:acrylyl-CoA reductase (NADPH)|nr:acryloyl-CoA reductase [Alphaproteobacteria bacterium]
MSECKALMVNRGEDKSVSHQIETIKIDDLPADGDVLVAVEYSTLNYKDGLCIAGKGGLVRNYPHIPGIDFAGEVVESADQRYAPGDKVVLTGWRVGEIWWGGYAQFARVKADWLVPLVDGMSCFDAMAIGTAGLTAMLSIMSLEKFGIRKDGAEVLVTGASGGVGSIAVVLLSEMGYRVSAITGRREQAEYLRALGATQIIARDDIMDGEKKPIQSAKWAGCVDSVGGDMLARVLTQMKPLSAVTVVGNAGGNDVSLNIIPLMLRGVGMIGVDSASCAFDTRIEAWKRLERDLPKTALESVTSVIGLADVAAAGKDILAGRVRGRVVVDVNR